MTGSSILMIYTGGTIGMKQDPKDQTLKPFDFDQIQEEVPELDKYGLKIDSFTFNPLIDSSDVEPSMWQSLATIIRDRYDDYDGFVVLHGTDTMAYSASALSFMLENLAKPVIFTGSQLPIGVPRTDGKENLISAVEIAAAKDSDGHPLVPEVCIFFDSLLRPESWNGPLRIATSLDTRVSILKVHPGITPSVMRYFLCGKETRAVIMETYGSGNAPSAQWFIDIVKEAASMGKVLMNVTQCLSGSVNMNLYATGKTLEKAGVVSGIDITTESALAKLFYLMGKSSDNEWVKAHLGDNLKGEISK